jgi:hypothetical protein
MLHLAPRQRFAFLELRETAPHFLCLCRRECVLCISRFCRLQRNASALCRHLEKIAFPKVQLVQNYSGNDNLAPLSDSANPCGL